ncbi:MAG: LamG domain-containing protein [Planctomycetota bacterium]|nr:MAG: LamG domain-containing protein [Planctomycetota bacterium]
MSKKLYFLIAFVLALGLCGVVQADPCDANLIGWWKFDEGEGNTVADSSVYDNTGVTLNPTPTWADGSPIDPCNSGMDFDGVSDYVVCAERDGNNPGTYPAELMPEKFTISCWTKLDAFNYYGGFVSNGHEGAEVGFFLQGGGNGNNFGISMGTITGWWDAETGTDYETDLWYHLAATYDGQYAAVYVDGELAAGPMSVSTINWQADNNDYPSNFVIGSWKDEGYAGAGLPVDGIIDDVRFYDYAMEVNDIKILAGIIPGAATDPNPRYGAKDADMYTDLSWTAGTGAQKHDVYFGTDEAAVADANIDVNFGVYMGRQDTTVFSNSSLVPALEMGKKYYWRIDEVNETAATLIKGRVWSFTVANYIIVDDFDSYATNNDLWAVWDDYWTNGSGAEVFVEMDPALVRKGNSIKFDYLNTYVSTGKQLGSFIDADIAGLNIGPDWTVSEAKALVLYFYGQSGNSATANDKMWVELEDTSSNTGAMIYNGDPNDVKLEQWTEWNIDLADANFSSVSLTNVDKVHIGFGNYYRTGQAKAGGSGTVYFDDIVVWQQRCVPKYASVADFSDDCVVDGYDLEIMSDDWLVHDYNVLASEPCDANLAGWWKFDEGEGNTVEDSSAYNNNGATVHPGPIWVGGYPNDPCDSALSFDGSTVSYNVVCAVREGNTPGTYPAELMPDTFTIACWTKLDAFSYYGAFVTNGTDGEAGFYLWNTEGDTADEGTFSLSMHTDSADWQDVMPTNIYVIDTWYHIAFSYDGQYGSFYVDGVLVEGPQDVGSPVTWIRGDTGNYPDNFVIGSWEDEWWSSQIDGVIDEVRYYDYALEAGEVAVLAGLQGSIYVPLDVPANLVPKDPCDSADPNLGTGAFDPNNMDIVNFLDYSVLADNWLDETLWPAP